MTQREHDLKYKDLKSGMVVTIKFSFCVVHAALLEKGSYLRQNYIVGHIIMIEDWTITNLSSEEYWPSGLVYLWPSTQCTFELL